MIRKIKLSRKQKITTPELFKLCASARNSNDYIRIDLWNRKYIVVSFHRDQTLSISNNFTDLIAYYATQNMIRLNKIYSTENVVDYLFKMIQKYNK